MIDKTLDSSKDKKTNVLVVEEQGKKLFIDVISGNQIPIDGMYINFVMPNIVEGEIDAEIEESEIKFWKSSFIMYVLCRDLSMNVVK